MDQVPTTTPAVRHMNFGQVSKRNYISYNCNAKGSILKGLCRTVPTLLHHALASFSEADSLSLCSLGWSIFRLKIVFWLCQGMHCVIMQNMLHNLM